MFAFNKLRLPPNHHTFTRIFDVGLNLIDLRGRGLFFGKTREIKVYFFARLWAGKVERLKMAHGPQAAMSLDAPAIRRGGH